MIIDYIIRLLPNYFAGLLATIATLAIFHLLFAPKIRFSNDVRLFFPVTDKRPYYSVRFFSVRRN